MANIIRPRDTVSALTLSRPWGPYIGSSGNTFGPHQPCSTYTSEKLLQVAEIRANRNNSGLLTLYNCHEEISFAVVSYAKLDTLLSRTF